MHQPKSQQDTNRENAPSGHLHIGLQLIPHGFDDDRPVVCAEGVTGGRKETRADLILGERLGGCTAQRRGEIGYETLAGCGRFVIDVDVEARRSGRAWQGSGDELG